MAETEMHTAWHNLKADMKDADPWKGIYRAYKGEENTDCSCNTFLRMICSGNRGAVTPTWSERVL